MVLSQFSVLKAGVKGKPYRIYDGDGLHILIRPNGSKLWRFRYRFAGKENTLGLGAFPEVSIAMARSRRDDARKKLAEGVDPSAAKKIEKVQAAISADNTFGAIAAEYLDKLKSEGASKATLKKNRWLLLDKANALVKRPIKDITAAEILVLLQKIEKPGKRETAQRLRGTIGSVFRFAVATLRADTDPTYALRGALLKVNTKHRAAITDERSLGILMSKIDGYEGWPALTAALQFLALTMVRPGDVRFMRPSEVNFDKAIWRIPAERMKMRRPHDVPLSRQAVAVLRRVSNYSGEFVFPSVRSTKKPLSENTFNKALRILGYSKDEMTAHGFRSSASTILNERGHDGEVVEAALAHEEEDEVRRAYNRAKYLKQRVKLMQDWANLLDKFRKMPAARKTA